MIINEKNDKNEENNEKTSQVCCSCFKAENNPLDETEKSVYRKRTILILIIEIIVFLTSSFIFDKWFAETVALGMFTESLLVIMGLTRKHNN
ncbi:MAG: accessory gene regulator B family protein [Ruminococcus sp.]|nr:accessory gene regulator B family protein [Ruminococcus sp.]